MNACGITKNFVIDSNPKGALVVIQPQENGSAFVDGKAIFRETPHKETPATASIWFVDETKTVRLVEEKLGYSTQSQLVSKDLSTGVMFDLTQASK